MNSVGAAKAIYTVSSAKHETVAIFYHAFFLLLIFALDREIVFCVVLMLTSVTQLHSHALETEQLVAHGRESSVVSDSA